MLGITQIAIIHTGIHIPISTPSGMAAIVQPTYGRMMPIQFMKIARTTMIPIVAASARAFSPRETQHFRHKLQSPVPTSNRDGWCLPPIASAYRTASKAESR